MKKIFSLIMLFVLAATAGADAAEGFYTSGTKLMDANGNEFVARGVNYSYAWQRGNERRVIKAAKEIGCNAIRIQLSTGKKWQKCYAGDIERIMNYCVENKLVCILNTHDETGSNNYADLENAANYWIEMKDVLNRYRKYLLVNISNEWYGSWQSDPWAEGYKKVIPMLRKAGIKNTLVVDCAGYGQYPRSLSDCGRDVAAADTEHNIVFSMHFYQDAANTSDKVRSNIDNALKVGVPVILGEFAYKHQGHDIAWQTILDYTKEKNVGTFVWSWTGNGGGAEDCDMFGGYDASDWKPNGTNTVKGRNGIQQTSKECSIFDPNGGNGGGGDDPDPTPNPGGNEGTTVLWEGSYDVTWDELFEYKNVAGNADWKAAQMAAMQEGDKLVFTYTNVSHDAKAPGQIQLATFGLDSQWSWATLVAYDDIPGNVYTYVIANTPAGANDETDLEMISHRGFAVKGQNATLVKIELVSKNGGGSTGEETGGETVIDSPNYNIATWDELYHIEKSKLGGNLTSKDKVRLYVSCKAAAEVQVCYKTADSDWSKYIDYAPIAGDTYDIPMTDPKLLEGANYDGLYIKGHDYTILKVSVIRAGQSGVEETVAEGFQPEETIDFDQPYEIYTLDGRRVGEMLSGTVYILRQGSVILKYVRR